MLKIFFFLNKKKQLSRFWLEVIFFAIIVFIIVGCTKNSWEDFGDSCILISKKPPLRRVINYTDHDLCGRKLPPRVPPNPLTRVQTGTN